MLLLDLDCVSGWRMLLVLVWISVCVCDVILLS